MCWQAVANCIERSQQSGPAYLLLLIIAEKINEQTADYPITIGELMQRARMSKSQVYAHLAALKQSGELHITRRGKGRCAVYKVAFYPHYSGNPETLSDIPENRNNEATIIPEIRNDNSGNPDKSFRKSGKSTLIPDRPQIKPQWDTHNEADLIAWEQAMNIPYNARTPIGSRFMRFERWVNTQGTTGSNGLTPPTPPLHLTR